jgi:hypothetical protein
MMMIFGPVANAAHGGHSEPTFDLIVGLRRLGADLVRLSEKKRLSEEGEYLDRSGDQCDLCSLHLVRDSHVTEVAAGRPSGSALLRLALLLLF